MLSLLRKNCFNKLIAADLNCQQRLQKAIRALSTLNPTPQAGEIVYKDERRDYLAAFPDVVKNLTEYASKYQLKDAVKLYEKALQYNVGGTSQQTGIVTILTYKELANKVQLNSENIKLAQYLGWCVDMLICALVMFDDIEDGSATRRGKRCWYMFEEVGLTAMNHSLMILSGAFHILKENFGQKDCYVKLLELFNEVIFITAFGQSMDLNASKGDVNSFTMDRYKAICANKTSYLGLYLPIASALHLCGVTDPDVYTQTKTTIIEVGYLGQVLNDFSDCFGDPERTGKIASDIQENKCTWLAVMCMDKASEAQKKIMRECYGKNDPIKIAQVKHLYEELDLPNIFKAYKQEAYNKIITQSHQNSEAHPSRLYKILAPLTSRNSRLDLIATSYF